MKKILKWFFIGLLAFIGLVILSTLLPKSDVPTESKTKVAQVKESPKKPKHSYADFLKWVTTVSSDDINVTRWSVIDKKCTGGTNEECYKEEYKEYISPDAFANRSSKDNGSSSICASDSDYSYACSRFGDLLSRIRAYKSGVDTRKNYFDAEVIYNDIASKKG